MGSRKLPRSSLKEKKVQKRIKETNSTNGEKKEGEEKVVVETKKVQSKMTLCTTSTAQTRPTRRPGRPPIGKSYVGLQRQKEISAKVRSTYRRSLDPCDNSNDSGLGFGDHHMDPHHHRSDRLTWTGERSESKRQKIDVKLEREEANDNYCFPENVLTSKDNISLSRSAPTNAISSPLDNGTAVRSVPRNVPFDNKQSSTGIIPLTTQLMATSRYSNVSLQILKQPEQQHRARYQTEGSRGAVKDREGNGFPVVQLLNYYQPATLQVYIGTDAGRISPHIFYQACKVSGKNSTPCTETKIEGTCVIELQLDPSKDMKAICDCVGILKERNVDVEHRFPDQLGNRPKKKSTKCRMIFRTTITLDDGNKETLQVCSQPIVCTQPPGIPEICKKSLTSCPASGGLELFVLGKNFLKDTRVFFQQYEENQVRWEQTVVPDKEYLQQTHFVCVVPPYRRPDIAEPVSVRLCVMSSGKTSESHQFVYTPVNGVPSVMVDALPPPPPFFKSNFWQSNASISKREQDQDMMPPPDTSLVPVSTRRPSMNLLQSINDSHSPPMCPLKQEYVDESSQCSLIDQDRYRHLSESSLDAHQGDSNISMLNENSMMSHMNDNSNISVGNEDTAIDIVRGGNEDSSSSTPSTSILNEQTSAVMDLRMKLPIATVADLVNTTAPSIAALQRFGIMEHPTEPLPNQSAQSVENYLNKIEAKPSMIPLTNPTGLLMKNDLSRIINGREPMFPATNRPFMSCRSQNEVVNIVAKSESAEVPVPIPERNDTTASSTITTVSNSLERIVPTPINTEKLDALVNSTVESHLSPTSPKDVLVPEAIIPAGDVMLNPMMMTTTTTTTSILGRNELPDNPNLTTTTTPEAILSTQISPNLMCANTRRRENLCRSAQRPLLTTAAAVVTAPVNLASLTTEAEKVVLLNAAVDLLETQQQLHGIGGGGATAPADDFVARSYGSPMVKEMVPSTQNDKNKTVDGMIPQGFTALTENELISLINPSCFDQGNNNYR